MVARGLAELLWRDLGFHDGGIADSFNVRAGALRYWLKSLELWLSVLRRWWLFFQTF